MNHPWALRDEASRMPSDPFVARASPSPCRAHCPTPQGSGCRLGLHAPRRTAPRCSRSTRQRFSQGKSEGLRSLEMCPLRSSLPLVYNHAWPLRFDSSSKSTDKSRYTITLPTQQLTQPPRCTARARAAGPFGRRPVHEAWCAAPAHRNGGSRLVSAIHVGGAQMYT
jgi:hypothetical protein